ncbi:glycosyltransferase family 32 protein [Elioraea rosea]|uniref:glycosyltransferase family 32 protein n=1 Tax=Elioraea rosea TaxID=2492390 RepID=UPI001182E838|nr:glycosyltransferase [Elioraea rosea]
MIPAVLHYIWVGPRRMPPMLIDALASWRAAMPEFRIACWNEDTIDFSEPFLRRAYALRRWSTVADFVRLDVLAREGGFYLDTDVFAVRSFEPLRRHGCVVGFQSREPVVPSGDWVCNAVIGAAPGHPLLVEARASLLARFRGTENIGSETGPSLLTSLLRQRGLSSYADEPQEVGDVTVVPTDYFYPYRWDEEYDPSCITPRTYAVHRWAESWTGAVRSPPLWWKVLRRVVRFSPDPFFSMQRKLVERQREPA